MRTRIAILTALVALTSATPIQAQTVSSNRVGDLSYPAATVKTPINVTVDSSVGINANVVSWLVAQPEVLLAAARELDPEAKSTNVVGEVRMSVAGHAMPSRVEISLPGVRDLENRTMLSGSIEIMLGPTAEGVPPEDREQVVSNLRQIGQRLTGALASHLEKSLTQIESRQLAAARDRAERVAMLSGRMSEQVREDSERLVKELKSYGIGEQPEAVLVQSIGDLTKQKLELELERAGLQARAQALQEQTRVAAKRFDEASQTDEIVQNFQRVVDLQRQRQESLRAAHQAGQLGQKELSQGEIDLATATVELAKAQRAAGHPRVQELERLSSELANSAVRSAECEAKLRYVAEQLEKGLSSWQSESGVGRKLRNDLNDLQKRAELFKEEYRRSHVDSVLLQSYGGVRVETFSNPQDK